MLVKTFDFDICVPLYRCRPSFYFGVSKSGNVFLKHCPLIFFMFVQASRQASEFVHIIKRVNTRQNPAKSRDVIKSELAFVILMKIGIPYDTTILISWCIYCLHPLILLVKLFSTMANLFNKILRILFIIRLEL